MIAAGTLARRAANFGYVTDTAQKKGAGKARPPGDARKDLQCAWSSNAVRRISNPQVPAPA
jgi:hypothetical protein